MSKQATSTIDLIGTDLDHLENILNGFELEPTDEALEFTEAIRNKLEDLENEMDELTEAKFDLQQKVDDFEEKEEELPDLETFQGLDTIYWSADNLMDRMVMEAVQEAYGKYSPQQILQKLRR
jgi:hypothetical protein